MRALAAALAPLLCAAAARAAELGFVYVGPNVGTASGGHAALVADGVVYHLQNQDGLVLVVREGWPEFRLVYEELENRPLSVAHLDVAPEAVERVQRAFARIRVEQELALARRDAAREDVAWLEAFAAGAPAPALRGAGLLDPAHAGDPEAARLRDRAAAGDPARSEPVGGGQRDLASLREALLAREANRALAGAYALAPLAVAQLPAALDVPLSGSERAALESLCDRLERAVASLVRSARPDRGYPLLLAQARYLAARRSLSSGRLVLLDVFAGRDPPPDDAPEEVRAKRRAEAAELLRRGRELVLAPGRSGEADLNLLEEAASAAAHDGRADLAGPLSEIGLRKLPALARSVAAPAPAVDLRAALAAARARLAAEDARLAERWSYALVQRNCITELARATDGAFGSGAEVARALGAPVPGGEEPFGFVPFVFFERVRDRLRVTGVDELPSRRAAALARVLAESPGLATRLRESLAYSSTVYEPKPRDSAFLLFTDDVFWRRPAYGLVNLAFGVGYAGVGLVAAPFDRGTRLSAGLEGALWSLPELGFVNVRKGTYDWRD